MKHASLISRTVSGLLIIITLPVYFSIGALSLMAFDAPGSSLAPWLISGAVIANCVLIVVGSGIVSFRLLRHGKNIPGVLVSLVPLVGLVLFWLWLRTQSFA